MISIINPAVNVIHNVSRTGAVDKYFRRLSIRFISMISKKLIKKLDHKIYRGETVTSLSGATNSPLINSCQAEIGQI